MLKDCTMNDQLHDKLISSIIYQKCTKECAWCPYSKSETKCGQVMKFTENLAEAKGY